MTEENALAEAKANKGTVYNGTDLSRHCEERSDEAIFKYMNLK